MDFNNSVLLLITFIPLLGGMIMLTLPAKRIQLLRWSAFVISLIPLVLTAWSWFAFDRNSSQLFQFQVQLSWFDAIHSSLHFGVDGISLVMVLLTTLLTPLAILTAFNIKNHVKAFMILSLIHISEPTRPY
jgi:NADH-quinone oxidoreductase subunit M